MLYMVFFSSIFCIYFCPSWCHEFFVADDGIWAIWACCRWGKAWLTAEGSESTRKTDAEGLKNQRPMLGCRRTQELGVHGDIIRIYIRINLGNPISNPPFGDGLLSLLLGLPHSSDFVIFGHGGFGCPETGSGSDCATWAPEASSGHLGCFGEAELPSIKKSQFFMGKLTINGDFP